MDTSVLLIQNFRFQITVYCNWHAMLNGRLLLTSKPKFSVNYTLIQHPVSVGALSEFGIVLA
jgi:hypothetical protein